MSKVVSLSLVLSLLHRHAEEENECIVDFEMLFHPKLINSLKMAMNYSKF